MVDSLQSKQPIDTKMLAVPQELASKIQEIISLYDQHNQQSITNSLDNLISEIKRAVNHPFINIENTEQLPENLTDSEETEIHDIGGDNQADFRKRWDDIFNVQVYIDTDIFWELDPRPPALVEIDSSQSVDTIIQHTDATAAYVQTWKDIAQSISSYPDDLFTRLWTTSEIAKIVECSPSSLRRARRTGRLPIKAKDLVLDCIAHDGKRQLWFVRPD